jgi:ATP-dependent DNA helicase Q4
MHMHYMLQCPPVAVAIAKVKQQLGSLESLTNKLEFNIVELSDMLGWESGPVRKELKLLTWELGMNNTV